MKPHRWLRWAWKIAFATYIGGALTLLPGSSLIVFWTVLLYSPLIAWTLFATRSRRLAAMTMPVLGSALVSAAVLFMALRAGNKVPTSPVFAVLFFVGVLGPLALYPFVNRELLRDSPLRTDRA